MRVGSKESMDKLTPAVTTKGRLFLVTTPGDELIYLDNGSQWVPLNNAYNTEAFEKINETQIALSLLQGALQKEVERAGNEEQSLAMKLSVLTTEMNTLTTEANIIIISLNNEITRSQQSEKNLLEEIDKEVKRSKGVERVIEKGIEEQRLNLNHETERAKEAEEGLQGSIDCEVERMNEIKNSLKNEINQLQVNLNESNTRTQEWVEELKSHIEYIQSIRQYGYFTSGSSDQHIGQMGQEAVSFNGPQLSSDGIELMPMKSDSIIIQSEGTYRFSFIVGVKSVGPALFGLVDENNSALYTSGTFGFSSLGVNYSPLIGEAILRIPSGGVVIQLKNINDHITTMIGSVPDINSSTPNTHAATLLIERIN